MKIRELNVYIEEVKPWALAKQGDEQHLQEVLNHAVATLQQVAQLLWPFMPQTSETILKIFEGGVISKFSGVLFPKKYNHTEAPVYGKPKPAALAPDQHAAN